MAEKKTSGGSKLTRTQTVTVRFDPKLRYLAELAARKQRRTVSSFIEWAVEEALKNIVLQDNDNNEVITLAEEVDSLWDVDEAERFARLAAFHPELLSHDEQVLWKVIYDSNLLTFGKHRPNHNWNMELLQKNIFPNIRKNWRLFNEIAQGLRSSDDNLNFEVKKVPKVPSNQESQSSNYEGEANYYDDDIPF